MGAGGKEGVGKDVESCIKSQASRWRILFHSPGSSTQICTTLFGLLKRNKQDIGPLFLGVHSLFMALKCSLFTDGHLGDGTLVSLSQRQLAPAIVRHFQQVTILRSTSYYRKTIIWWFAKLPSADVEIGALNSQTKDDFKYFWTQSAQHSSRGWMVARSVFPQVEPQPVLRSPTLVR